LEQIVVLKFLGLPLKRIRNLLLDDSGLIDELDRQERALTEKWHELDLIIQTIRAAKQSLSSDQGLDWNLFNQIIRSVEKQNNMDWTQKYYSDEAKRKIEARKTLWSPELQARVTQQWNELFADIEANLDQDPASPAAQALAARWKNLLDRLLWSGISCSAEGFAKVRINPS
jgi:hypothetical protein